MVQGPGDWRPRIRAATALARSFHEAGKAVLILDVLSEESARLFRGKLPGVAIDLLIPIGEETERRYRQREAAEGVSRLGDDFLVECCPATSNCSKDKM